jgi:hypothetical protein
VSLAAECLVATTGVLRPRRVTRSDGAEAARLPRQWRTAVREWIEQERPRRFRLDQRPDHESTLENLTRGVSLEELADVHRELEAEMASAYDAQLSNAREYLRALWPALALDTPMGPRALEPSLTELGDAYAALAVVERPERILDELRMGTLQDAQVQALAAVYPGLLQMLQAMIQEEILRQLTRRRGWSMRWWHEQLWRQLLGLPPELPLSEVKQPPARAASPAPIQIEFREQASKAERIAAL